MKTELRWLVYTALDAQTGLSVTNKRLQYRVMQDVTVWAGMPTHEQKQTMANYQWSPWMDVPEIVENKEGSK